MNFKIVTKLALCLIIKNFIPTYAFAKYILHSPKNEISTTAPLIIVLHESTTSTQDFADITRLSDVADKEGFYVLYPQLDELRSWPYFLPEEQIPGQGKANFIIQDIEKIKMIYPINPNKVYLVGMGDGAAMASILAACYPNVFQGVAFHSGTSYGQISNWTEALKNLKNGPSPEFQQSNTACDTRDFKGKVLIFQGTKDEIVNFKHLERLSTDFLENTKMETLINNEDATHFSYTQRNFKKNEKIRGESYLIDGLGHTWSGGRNDGSDQKNNPTKIGPDATNIILNFFLNHK
jgi:poly(hydroxyalkanoate) depolymerase family esterase